VTWQPVDALIWALCHPAKVMGALLAVAVGSLLVLAVLDDAPDT
jgi:hypothetical protein